MSSVSLSPLTLCLLQTHTHWHDPNANQRHFENLFAAVPAQADIVVMPEMWSTGFTMASAEVAEPMDGPSVQWMLDQARSMNKVVCGSVVVQAGGKHFNRFIWAAPGETVVTYDKRHLFRMAGEHEHYAPGDRKIVVQYKGWRICPMVCYDLRFPVWFRNHTTNDGRLAYDLLLCVANWPAARRDAWNALLKARAIENLSYAAGVNITGVDGNQVAYSGGTCAYHPNGETLLEIFDREEVATVTLQAQPLVDLREAFPAWQDADPFTL